MSRLPLIALLIAPALLGGCATAQDEAAEAARHARVQAEIADALKGLSPGEPRNCIDQTRVHDIKTYAGTILYRYSPREVYRNDVSGGCFGLGRGDIVVTKTSTSRLCRGDLIHTVSPGSSIPSGSCGLGDFIPYKKR